MTSNQLAFGIVKSVLLLGAITLSLYLFYQISVVFIYLLVSIIIGFISNPLIEFLKKKLKFPNTLAVVFTLILILILIIGFVGMFIPLINSQTKSLSLLDTNSIQNNLLVLYDQASKYLLEHNIDMMKIIQPKDLTSKINLSFIPSFFNAILNFLASFGMGLASILFILFFILKDKLNFIAGLKYVLPEEYEEKILYSWEKIYFLLSRYFGGLLLQLLIVFILYLIVLLIFGIEHAFIIAFLCALLNIIPYIGPLIGMFLAATLTMISNINQDFTQETLPTTLYVMIGFMVVQMIDNNINQPLIFSKSTQSHPLEIFFVILMAGLMGGITSMIVAIPLYTILKVIAKEFFSHYKLVYLISKKI
jgi:predicted PurR-regulated permease PerM